MDPNANITEQLRLARELQALAASDRPIRGYLAELADKADRLSEPVLALDEWQRAGGFSPYASKC